MSFKTLHFRHVWREANDGNRDCKVLALQQFNASEGWEHDDYKRYDEALDLYGSWEDVEINTKN